MKTAPALAVSHFLATILGGAVVAFALSGCSNEVPGFEPAAETARPPVLIPAHPIVPGQVHVDSCASFQGSWALQAPRCPDGTHPVDGTCDVFGAGAALLASGPQGDQNWGCQATNSVPGSAFSICAHVICE